MTARDDSGWTTPPETSLRDLARMLGLPNADDKATLAPEAFREAVYAAGVAPGSGSIDFLESAATTIGEAICTIRGHRIVVSVTAPNRSAAQAAIEAAIVAIGAHVEEAS